MQPLEMPAHENQFAMICKDMYKIIDRLATPAWRFAGSSIKNIKKDKEHI
jgi:hypothetical protein